MFAGKIAGKVASKAIIKNSFDKKVLSEYNKQWRKYLYVEHLLGRFSLELLRNTDDIKIDYIFSLLENKNINLFLKNNILKTSLSLASYLIKKDPLILFKLIF